MSTKINDGGPAFPMQEPQAIHSYAAAAVADIPATETDKRDAEYMKARGKAVGGMSLRDHYAGLALAALIGKEDKDYQNRGPKAVPILAAWAWEYADAMLRARATGKGD